MISLLSKETLLFVKVILKSDTNLGEFRFLLIWKLLQIEPQGHYFEENISLIL
jgi:hypothetical protein